MSHQFKTLYLPNKSPKKHNEQEVNDVEVHKQLEVGCMEGQVEVVRDEVVGVDEEVDCYLCGRAAGCLGILSGTLIRHQRERCCTSRSTSSWGGTVAI